MKRFFLYYHTIKYLKWQQIRYRLWYLARRRLGVYSPALSVPASSRRLMLGESIARGRCYEDGAFTFLNLTKSFGDCIDWDYPDFGRHWCYNLNYFDFLNQEGMTGEEGLRLIHSFIETMSANSVGLEPYPTSLRIINWVKFVTRHAIQNESIDASLNAQAMRLRNNLEYHLLGNHLLENGFALLFAGTYCKNENFSKKAEEILLGELTEQVLPDGGHFERSPMYHQIILDRLLDSINLVESNGETDPQLVGLLRHKASLMLGWLREMGFANGDIPLVNDAAEKIAPTTAELLEYGRRLGIDDETVRLGESGYRKVARGGFEMVIDVGPIGPDYIPGHAHSDSLSFVLHHGNRPLIVDTGVSTYEAGPLRHNQRSTAAHNTVEVDGLEQSEVWGSFRVGRRARVKNLKETADCISAEHNGYARIGAVHRREFCFGDDGVVITDAISSRKGHACRAFLHFHPDVAVALQGNKITADGAKIVFEGASRVGLEDYQYAPEFNRLIPGKMGVVEFSGGLRTEILSADCAD